MNDPDARRLLTRSRELLQNHWTVGTVLTPEQNYWGEGEFMPYRPDDGTLYPTMCSVGALRVSDLFVEEELTDLFLADPDCAAMVHDDHRFRFDEEGHRTDRDRPYRRALLYLIKSLPDDVLEAYGHIGGIKSIFLACITGDWDGILTATLEDVIINWNDSLPTSRHSLAHVLEVFDKAIGMASDDETVEEGPVVIPIEILTEANVVNPDGRLINGQHRQAAARELVGV